MLQFCNIASNRAPRTRISYYNNTINNNNNSSMVWWFLLLFGCIRILSLATIAYVIIILWYHGLPTHVPSKEQVQQGIPNGFFVPSIFDVSELSNEDRFHSTIKNCNNFPTVTKKCGVFIPTDKQQEKIQRIALITLPGDFSIPLRNRIEALVKRYNNNRMNISYDTNKQQSSSLSVPPIELIVTTHVPPYGYGKTHGLTKIIRIVPRPLILQVTSTLHRMLLDKENTYKSSERQDTKIKITLQDVKAAFRQIMRFHCRLSHVAAHTAIDSIPLLDFLNHPTTFLQRIHTFLVHDHNNYFYNNRTSGNEAIEAENQNKVNEFLDVTVESINDELDSLFQAETAFASRLMTQLQQHMTKENTTLSTVLNEVLLDELNKSKNFTSWPCESFWTVGDDDASNNTNKNISPMIQKLARLLSPDCNNDPYITCFVKRDKCEANGDGICKD